MGQLNLLIFTRSIKKHKKFIIMNYNKNHPTRIFSLFFLLIGLLTIISCSDSDMDPTIPEVIPETADLTSLPFGGPLILRRDQGDMQPDFGFLWLCGVPQNGAGNDDASDWTNPDGTWDYTRKPFVEGSVDWISEFEVALDGNGNRIITGNALPDHPTGVFPIDPNSVAYQYDRNMNEILAREILFEFPAIPEAAEEPSCVTYGAAGISLTGSVIYHGASTLGNDAAAHELLDSYPAQDLQDHIHPDAEEGHSGLMGYVIDGFGIYGPHGEDGELLSSADLDECHGHTHPVLWDGEMIDLYHYHWTYDFPYNIGCFKGTPN
jgi:hypothetical protein